MEETTAYMTYFSKNTRDLMETYVLKFKDPASRDTYMKVYDRFAEYAKKDWFECRARDFKGFMGVHSKRYQADEISYSTYAKYYKILAAFSRHCYKIAHAEVPSPLVPSDYEDYVTVARVKAPADVFSQAKIPSLAEVEKVLAYTKAADRMTYFAVLFALGTFVKTGEFMKIKTSDLMQDASGTWFVRLSDGYMVVLDGDFGSELAEYMSATLSAGDYLFSKAAKDGNRPISKAALSKRLVKACERAGVECFTFNELRNAAAVYTASAGATKEEIATSMRYKTPAHFDRLTSLTLPKRNDASRFIHFTLKDDSSGTESNA